MKKYITFIIALSLFILPAFVSASRSMVSIPVSCSTQGTSATSLSTTSISYMTPGTATSTATCNMQRAGAGIEVFDKSVVIAQMTASSTSSVITGGVEQSYDGIDWYPVSLREIATSTASRFTILPSGLFSWTFASSTNGGGATLVNGDTNTIMFEVPTFLPFVRTWFANQIGATRAGIWATIIGKTEIE
jgi:hypothetical protein